MRQHRSQELIRFYTMRVWKIRQYLAKSAKSIVTHSPTYVYMPARAVARFLVRRGFEN